MRIKLIMAIVLVVVVMIGVGMIPWYDGYLVKQNYLSLLKALSVKNQTQIKVISYHRGWLTSDVKLEIESSFIQAMNSEDNPAGQIVRSNPMIIEQHIKHGPLVFDDAENAWTLKQANIQSRFTLPVSMKLFLKNKTQSPDIQMNTNLSFFGAYHSNFESAPFTIVIIPGLMEINWQGWKGTIVTYLQNNQIKQTTGNMTIGDMSAKSSFGSYQMRAASYQYDLMREPTGWWSGKQSMSLPNISITDAQGIVSNMTNLNISFLSRIAPNNLYHAEMTYSLQGFTSSDFSVNPSSLTLIFDNFNEKAMMDLLRTTTAVGKMAMMHDARPQMYAFSSVAITPESVINGKINFTSNVGKLTSSGQIYWPKNFPLPKDTNELIAGASAKVEVHVSMSLVNYFIDKFYQNNSVDNSASIEATQPTENGLLAQIDVWTKSNEIPLDVSFQLKDLVARHLPASVFATNIATFVTKKEISQSIADQMKARYALLYPDPKKTPAPPMLIPVVQAPVAPVVISPAEKMKNSVAEWVKQGYLTINNDEYVTTITREQGVVKLNGVPL
jgi:uncharacterized protein YdgA (DUF945 family)